MFAPTVRREASRASPPPFYTRAVALAITARLYTRASAGVDLLDTIGHAAITRAQQPPLPLPPPLASIYPPPTMHLPNANESAPQIWQV